MTLTPPLQAMVDSVSSMVPLVEHDRALEAELRGLMSRIADQHWSLYPDVSTEGSER